MAFKVSSPRLGWVVRIKRGSDGAIEGVTWKPGKEEIAMPIPNSEELTVLRLHAFLCDQGIDHDIKQVYEPWIDREGAT